MNREAFSVRHPIFRPLWVRVLVVGLVGAWTLVEFAYGIFALGLVAGVAGGYLFHQFFWVFDPADYTSKGGD